MANKKPNILQRKVNGAVKPTESYHSQAQKPTSLTKQPSSRTRKADENKKKSLKIPYETYQDMAVLKNIEHIHYDYEIIQLAIDSYRTHMSAEQRRRFDILRENI